VPRSDDAIKDIGQGKRNFAQLSLQEIDAIQKKKPKFRGAIVALAESSRNLKKKAGKK
jgi:hypothetical protein